MMIDTTKSVLRTRRFWRSVVIINDLSRRCDRARSTTESQRQSDDPTDEDRGEGLDVAGSKLLQERARRFGDDWLHNRVKVHVNITNPVDWSYWSQQVIPLLGIPDVLMRDHRKIASPLPGSASVTS